MTRINVRITPTNLPDELLRKDVGMKVWYIIKGNRIKSCIEDENGYYVLKNIWVFKGGINKRPNIKQILKEPHVIDFSYRTSYIPYDKPLHFVLVDYPELREALMKFKRINSKNSNISLEYWMNCFF